MARRDEYESRVEKFLIPIMEENNFELVDVQTEAPTSYSTLRTMVQPATVHS